MSLYIRYIAPEETLTFSGSALSDVNLVTEADPSLLKLTADTLSFTVVVEDGVTLDLAEGQRVELYKDGVLEHTQFIKDFERLGKNRYRLICQSRIGIMEEPFYGKIYTPGGPLPPSTDWYYGRMGNTWMPARQLIDEVAAKAGCAVTYTDTTGLRDTTVAGYLPICPQRDALQQAAFAAGLQVSTRDGALTLREVPTEVSGEFGSRDIFYGCRVKQLPRIHRIDLSSVYENYVQQAWEDTGERIDAGNIYELSVCAQLINEPVYSVSEQSDEVLEEDEILGDEEVYEEFVKDYGVRWYVGPGSPGYVAKCIEFQKKTHSRALAAASDKENVLSVEGCTLLFEGNYPHDWATEGSSAPAKIYTQNVTPVLDRLEAYAQLRVLVEQEVIVRGQRAGDYVRTVTPWGSCVEGYIISMDARLTQNGHRARVKILGKFVEDAS